MIAVEVGIPRLERIASACSLTSGSTRAVTLELLIAIQRHHLSCRQYTTLYVGLQYNITSGTTAGIEFYAETV